MKLEEFLLGLAPSSDTRSGVVTIGNDVVIDNDGIAYFNKALESFKKSDLESLAEKLQVKLELIPERENLTVAVYDGNKKITLSFTKSINLKKIRSVILMAHENSLFREYNKEHFVPQPLPKIIDLNNEKSAEMQMQRELLYYSYIKKASEEEAKVAKPILSYDKTFSGKALGAVCKSFKIKNFDFRNGIGRHYYRVIAKIFDGCQHEQKLFIGRLFNYKLNTSLFSKWLGEDDFLIFMSFAKIFLGKGFSKKRSKDLGSFCEEVEPIKPTEVKVAPEAMPIYSEEELSEIEREEEAMYEDDEYIDPELYDDYDYYYESR